MRFAVLALAFALTPALRAQDDCLRCHAAQAETFARSGMSKSVSAPHTGEALIAHRLSRSRLMVLERAGRSIHKAERGGFTAEYPIAFAVGSGRIGQTFAVETGGRFFESPVSWYAQRKQWDLSPGYEGEPAPDFDREITAECLSCHAGTPRTRAAVPQPITCNRCHAPSGRHFASIAALEPAKRDAVCESCHLQGEVRILNPGSKWTDPQPSLTVYTSRTSAGPMRVISQVEQLASSRCAKESNSRLWCGSCHAVHGPRKDVRQVCLGCHSGKLPGGHAPESSECTSCHMPGRETPEVAHVVYTDHRIARRPEVKPVGRKAGSAPDLMAWREPAPELRVRNLGLAYISAGQQEQSAEWIQKGFALLWSLPARDAEVQAALGTVLVQKQRPKEAAALFAEAVRLDPGSASHLHNLAVALISQGAVDRGLVQLENSVRVDPWFLPSWLLLAQTRRQSGQEKAYRETLERFLEVLPQNLSARIALRNAAK